jgi:DnaJ homolog subfamily A member 2
MGPVIQQMQTYCPACKGKGETLNEKDKCTDCKGDRVSKEKKTLEVIVEKGMQHGQKVVFRGESDQAPNTEPGDVVFILVQKEHDVFERKGMDLIMTKEISLIEALGGFQFSVTHLDGRELLIKNPEGDVIKPGDIRSIRDEGMPLQGDPFHKGQLFIKFNVKFPDSGFLKKPAIQQLEKILPARPAAPVLKNAAEAEEVVISTTQTQPTPDPGRGYGQRSAHHHDDDEDDEEGGGPGVQCRQQ